MISTKKIYTLLLILLPLVSLMAQTDLHIEASGTTSTGDFAPTWLTSNRQGKVSPFDNSAYLMVGASRDCMSDSLRDWHFGYGVDLMLNANAQSTFFVQQLYGEIEYKKLLLTVGQKERVIDLRNNSLTSGGLSQGINAHPIPEAMLTIDYFSVPYTNQWWKMRGRVGFGKTTDANWQKNWVADGLRYTTNTLYHEKALYWKFGREDKHPLTFEVGIQMMTQFGGTSYNVTGRNHDDASVPIVNAENLKAFWHAFLPVGSSDATDGNFANVAGNTIGSYNMALTWNGNGWKAHAYFERMFEDQSMLTVQYGIFDHLVGVDVELPKNPYISHVLVEHISSKDQAGPIYHDSTQNMPESYTGQDNYYNHNIYTGWQNWGICMGNPLFKSPIYNSKHNIMFYNNRLRALHFGFDGNPTSDIAWRLLASFTRNWGTYSNPYPDVLNQQYYLAEVSYKPRFVSGLNATLGIGYDHGSVMGNSFGAQLTLCKHFTILNKKNK